MRSLNLIVAVDKKMGISSHGKIPWCVHSDMAHFKETTKNSVLIMGRKTWESIPCNKRKFQGRKAVIVISNTLSLSPIKDTLGKNNKESVEVGVKDNTEQSGEDNTKQSGKDNMKQDNTKQSEGEGAKEENTKEENNNIKEKAPIIAKCMNEAIVKAYDFFGDFEFPSIFICGGSRIYQEAIEKYMHMVESIYITLIPDDYMCDNFFPLYSFGNKIHNHIKALLEQNKKTYPMLYTFSTISEDAMTVTRKNLENNAVKMLRGKYLDLDHVESHDQCYVNLITQILKEGESKQDRTHIGTISLFNANLSFDLEKGFPLLTRRKIFYRGCFEETLFFLQGKTNTKELESKKVNIWKGNTSRDFLDKRGLTMLEEGDMGAGYGFLWRNFGADYMTGEKGVDQIQNVISELRNNPHSRRHIVSAWDPRHLWQAALPPCHILFQFYVRKNTYLDCKMTQRSCDVMLGLPFNIASYSLITHIIAEKVNLIAGKLHISIGDAHIYRNHIKQVQEFLSRPCLAWPQLKVSEKVKDKPIDELTVQDFTIENYASFSHIPMEMAI